MFMAHSTAGEDGGFLHTVTSWFLRFRDAVVNSNFSFADFSLGDKGFTDILIFIVNVFFTILTVVAGAIIVFALSRYVFRWIYSIYRRAVNGKIIWSEVEYEGVISDNESMNSVGQMDNMANIMKNTSTGINFGVNIDRPRYLVMIRLNPDDEQAHMYIGMNERDYDPNVLSSWASGANCSIEKVDFEDIGFVPRAPMALVKEDYDTANFNDAPNNSTVGGVVTRLQSSSGIKDGATVIVSYEPMSNSEERLTKKKILADNVAEGGDSAKLDLTARNVNIFLSKSPCRGTITSFSDTGDYSVSHSVLRTLSSNVPSLGSRTSSVKFETLHRRAGVVTIVPALFLSLLGLFGFVPMWIPLTLVAISLISVIGIPIMSSTWISMIARTEANPSIPPYLRISPRRILSRMVHKILPFSSSGHGEKFVPEPSMREVIPLYQTSMMQIASMPRDGKGASNIASRAIPQVAMSSSVKQDIDSDINADRVALLGTSVKTFDPVMITVDDLNNGIAVAGDRGSGKTNFLMNLYAGVSHLSHNKGNYSFTPFWLETKSDDIEKVISNVLQYDPLVVFVHDRNKPSRVCLEGPRFSDGIAMNDVKRNVDTLISGMEKLWGAGLFGPRSKQVAHSALTIAMLLNKKERDFLGISPRVDNPDRPNIMNVVNLLIGSDPTLNLVDSSRKVITPGGGKSKSEGQLERLASQYKSKIISQEEKAKILSGKNGERKLERLMELVPALEQLISLHQTPEAVNPLRNKIPVLLSSDGLWDTTTYDGTPRKEIPLSHFVSYFGPVVVDLTNRNSSITSDSVSSFSMLFHYMLWNSIKENCAGWAHQKKFTPIFVDELRNIVGDKDGESKLGEIVDEVSDVGRSYGVSHSVGFQRYTQLPSGAVNTVRGMTSKLYFTLRNAQDRAVVMEQIGEKTRFAAENIDTMPKGYCIADLTIGGERRSVFTMKVPYFPAFADAMASSRTSYEAFEKILSNEKKVISEDKKKKAEDFALSVSDEELSSTNYIDEHDSNSPNNSSNMAHGESDDASELNWL